MPPPPRSSAERTIKTYFADTMRVRVQMISDKTPSSSSWDGLDVKVDEYTYSGLVPISP